MTDKDIENVLSDIDDSLHHKLSKALKNAYSQGYENGKNDCKKEYDDALEKITVIDPTGNEITAYSDSKRNFVILKAISYDEFNSAGWSLKKD